MSTKATVASKRPAQESSPAPQARLQELFANETFIFGALLLLITLFAYYPVYQYPFVNFDDPAYVVNNPHIRSGLNWETISWAFTTFYQFNWHPVTWLSHALDVGIFQLQPAGHHVVNMLLHLANVLLLFLMLQRATGHAGRSAMVAGLFAIHPINVESVAWIAERKNLLSMFFFLLGMDAYRWYALAPFERAQTDPSRAWRLAIEAKPDLRRYSLMTLFFALGLMSKPQIITFPFLLLLWDYWPLERIALRQTASSVVFDEKRKAKSGERPSGEERMANREERSFLWLVKEKLPLFAICAASAVVTVVAQKAGGSVASLEKYSLAVRATNAVVSYVRYLAKAFWPTNLAVLYPHPWNPLPVWQVLAAGLVLVGITALVVVARRHRYLPVGWFWFLGALVPMIGIVHVGNQAMADRYAYLPFIGLFIMVCWGASDLVENADLGHTAMVVARMGSVLILLLLMIVNDRQLAYWANSQSLWQHTLAVTDGNYIAQDNLGHALIEEGKPDEALQHFRAALAIYPSDPYSLLVLAKYDQQQGRFQDAIVRYQQMERITPAGPSLAAVLSREGMAYYDMRDDAAAQAALSKAVAMNPQDVQGWIGLGMVAERSGNLTVAIANYKRAIDARPMRISYLMLAKALEQSGDLSGARLAREQANLMPGGQATTETYSGGILQK